MSANITTIEQWQQEVTRLQEQKTMLENQIMQVVQENDRLRADYRALMEGSCYQRCLEDLEKREATIVEYSKKVTALESYLDNTIEDLFQAYRMEKFAEQRRADRGNAMAAYSKDVANWQQILKIAILAFQSNADYDTSEHWHMETLIALVAEFENRCPEYESDEKGNVMPAGYSDIPF